MKKDQSLILIILIVLLCISTISCSQQTIDTDSLTDSTIDSLVNDTQDTNIIDSDLITDTENKTANTNSSSKDDDIIIDIKPWEEYTEMRVCFSYYNGENKPVENFRAIVYKANCHYYSVPGNTLCNKYHILIPLDDFLKALGYDVDMQEEHERMCVSYNGEIYGYLAYKYSPGWEKKMLYTLDKNEEGLLLGVVGFGDGGCKSYVIYDGKFYINANLFDSEFGKVWGMGSNISEERTNIDHKKNIVYLGM